MTAMQVNPVEVASVKTGASRDKKAVNDGGYVVYGNRRQYPWYGALLVPLFTQALSAS